MDEKNYLSSEEELQQYNKHLYLKPKISKIHNTNQETLNMNIYSFYFILYKLNTFRYLAKF